MASGWRELPRGLPDPSPTMSLDFSYRHLYYFWVVAREGGISRAAARLGMAVQTVSAQVRILERDLGAQLLKPAVMVNVLGQHVAPTRALIADHPEWNVHDYCKAEVRHDRKMGHITVLTDDTAKTVADLEATGCWDDLKKA